MQYYEKNKLLEIDYMGDKINRILVNNRDVYRRINKIEKITTKEITDANGNIKQINIDGKSVQDAGDSYNLFNKDTVESGFWLTELGDKSADNYWSISDYIEVESDKMYIQSGFTNLGQSPSTCFYDENKEFISGIKNLSSFTPPGNPSSNKREIVTTPSNCKYVKISVVNADLGTTEFKKNTTIPTPTDPIKIESLGESWNLIDMSQAENNVLIKENDYWRLLKNSEGRLSGRIYVNIPKGTTFTYKPGFIESTSSIKDGEVQMLIKYEDDSELYIGNGSKVRIFTLEKNVTSLYFYRESSDTDNTYTLFQPMVYIGNDDLPYKEYNKHGLILNNYTYNLLKPLSTPREDSTYWNGLSSQCTPLEDGWLNINIEPLSTLKYLNFFTMPSSFVNLKPSTLYKCILEIKNYETSGSNVSLLLFNTQGTNSLWKTLKKFEKNNGTLQNGKFIFEMETKEDFSVGTSVGMRNFVEIYTNTRLNMDIRMSVYEVDSSIEEYQNYETKQLNIPLTEPLRSLPSGTKDYLQSTSNNVNITRNIIKETSLNNLRELADGTGGVKRFGNNDTKYKSIDKSKVSAMSSYFEGVSYDNASLPGTCSLTDNYLVFSTTSTTMTLDEFKELVAQDDFEVYYQLKEPTTESYAIDKLTLLDGNSYIELETVVQSELNLEYFTYVDYDYPFDN